VEVRWEVGDSEAMTRIVQSGTATARAALAHAVHVEVGGLEPGRDYYYRFEASGVRSPTGRAKTLPGPGSVATVRFISAGCQRYEDGYFTAWRRIAGERSDFVLHYGD
jgi:alkaline phosphatase D